MSKESLTSSKYLASPEEVLIMVIDYQEKLLPHIYGSEAVLHKACKLVKFSQMLSLPIVVTEQYPQGLGPTAPQISALLDTQVRVLHKTTFSCARDRAIVEAVEGSGKSTVIVAGIETHICVGQTVCGLLSKSFTVHVLSDCVGSRSRLDHETGLERMRDAGAVVSTFEAFTYEILGSCEHPKFKQFLAQIVK